MSFRPTSQTDDDYTNMLPQISKEINGNFNLLYERQSTSQRRSNRNRNSIDVESNTNPTSLSLDNQSIASANDVEPLPTDTDLMLCNIFGVMSKILCFALLANDCLS